MKHLRKPVNMLLTLSLVLLTACASPQIQTKFVGKRIEGDLPAAVKELNTSPDNFPHTEKILINVNRHNCAIDALESGKPASKTCR